MADNVITADEVRRMVRHWLSTPPNGYLGSPYGSDPLALLQKPMSSGAGDAFLAKLLIDVPVLGAMPDGAVNLFFADITGSNDRKKLIIQVLGEDIIVGSNGTVQ